MGTIDQMTTNQRYINQFQYEQAATTQNQPSSSKENDRAGSYGRRVFLESPSLGNKEEEDMYR
jgi:hypothetical protein